jgi:hypothetical protein
MYAFSTTSARLAAIVFNDVIIYPNTFDFTVSQNNNDLRNRVNSWLYYTGLTNPNAYGHFCFKFYNPKFFSAFLLAQQYIQTQSRYGSGVSTAIVYFTDGR